MMRGTWAAIVGVLGLVACSTPLTDIGKAGAAASLGLAPGHGSTALAVFAAGGTLRLRGGVQGYGKLPNGDPKSKQSKREKRVERGHVLKMKKTGGAGRKGRVAKRHEEKTKREAGHSPWKAKRLAEQSEKRHDRKTQRIQSGKKTDIPAPGPPRIRGGAPRQERGGADRPGAGEDTFEALDEHGKKVSMEPTRVLRMPGATVPPAHEKGAGATELQEVSRNAGLRPQYDTDGNIKWIDTRSKEELAEHKRQLKEVLDGERRSKRGSGTLRSESPSDHSSPPPKKSTAKSAAAESAPAPVVAPGQWGEMAGGSSGEWAGSAPLTSALRGGGSGLARGGGKVVANPSLSPGKRRGAAGKASVTREEVFDIAEQVRVKRAAVAKLLADPKRRPLPRSPERKPRKPSRASKESFAAPKKSVAAHKRPVAASKELPTEPQLAEGPAAPIPEDFGMSADDEDFVMEDGSEPSGLKTMIEEWKEQVTCAITGESKEPNRDGEKEKPVKSFSTGAFYYFGPSPGAVKTHEPS